MPTKSLEAELAQLETRARQLVTPLAQRADHARQVHDHAERFLAELDNLPVFAPAPDLDGSIAALQLHSHPEPLDNALQVLARYVDTFGHNLGTGRFFAYIPSGALNEAALADYLAAVTNRYAGVGYAAPGVTRMDRVLIDWLADLIGYPSTCEGDLTSGASMAALSAIVTAREAAGITARDVHQHVVYATNQTHHTFGKALRVAGMAECVQREVAVDAHFRMDADVLDRLIQDDRKRGLVPWLVCATAGTTNVGAIDPLTSIADIASTQSLWLHVDAAYGGAFSLCPTGKARLEGLGRSDSLILDPHKGFFIPCGTGVLLVKNGQRLYEAFSARGEYMQDLTGDERSPCDLSAELTRPFRALRFWLPLRVHGTAVFAAALEEKLKLAQYFYREVQKIPTVQVMHAPDLSIVPFRCVPPTGDPDTFGRQLVERLLQDGRVYLTSTQLNSQFAIRMAILNYMSHREEVDLALTVLAELIDQQLDC